MADWIEDYNRTRRHSALDMRTPIAYERALLEHPPEQWRDRLSRLERDIVLAGVKARSLRTPTGQLAEARSRFRRPQDRKSQI